MEFRGTERTQQVRPAAPPIDLDAGRLDIVRAGLAGGFVLISVLVSVLGLVLVLYVNSLVVDILGAAIGGIGFTFGGVVLWVSVTEWTDHRDRVREWHNASIQAYIDLSGAEKVEQVSEWELSAANPAHVLIVALWAHMRVMEGEGNAFTVRKLNTPIFLGGRRVGNLSKLGAESMGTAFAKLGLIEGRREGYSGEWKPQTADDVLDLVVNHWR